MIEFSRRRVLAAAGVGVGGGVVYATDNPVHRSTVETIRTRRDGRPPTPGDTWFAVSDGAGLPVDDCRQLVGLRYRGRNRDDDTLRFDVLGITVRRRTGSSGTTPLVGTHSLWIGATGETHTILASGTSTNGILGGPLRPAADAAAELPVSRARLLGNPSAEAIGRILPASVPGDALYVLVDALVRWYEGPDDYVSRASVLAALSSAAATASGGDRTSFRHGSRYTWQPGGVAAHAVFYRAVEAEPGPSRLRLRAGVDVPRPSLVGSPLIRTGIDLSVPV